jgi:drug/metabolite transporter (DMT)-like permease
MPSATQASAAAPGPKGARGAALWVNLGIIYVVWGSTYFGIAIAIESMPPFLMAAIRFVIAGALLVAWDLLRNPEARRMPTRRQLLDSLIVGTLLLGMANAFVTVGEVTVPSGIAAIIVATIPLWFALLGWLYFRQKLPRIVVGAIALGFLGTALLVAPVGGGANSFDPLGILILFCAPLAWAHGSLYSARRAQLPPSPLTASGLQMLAGALVCFLEALVTGEPASFQPEKVTLASILAVAYLVLFGSMVAYTSYAWLLKNAPLSIVGTYAYVNPVVAIGLGTLFLGESLSLRTIVASGIIVAAVAIIVTTRGRLSGTDPDAIDASTEPGAGAPQPSQSAPSTASVATPAAMPATTSAAAAAGVRPAVPPRAPSG